MSVEFDVQSSTSATAVAADGDLDTLNYWPLHDAADAAKVDSAAVVDTLHGVPTRQASLVDGARGDGQSAHGGNRAAARTIAGRSLRHPRKTRHIRGDAWISIYVRQLVCADILSAILAVLIASLVRLPDEAAMPSIGRAGLPLALIMPFLWIVALAASDAYDRRILGLGPQEYQRTGRAFVGLMALVGFGSYALQADVARGFVLVALPSTAVLSAGCRMLCRKQLHRARTRGTVLSSVVAVGDVDSVIELARRIHHETYVGMRVVGACIPRAELADTAAVARLAEANVTPLGDLDSVVTAVLRAQADLVAVASSPAVSPKRLRELSWALESADADLVVAPGLMEVAGPRLHIRPVMGLPLLQIEKPEFSGARRLVKGSVDRLAAALGLLVLAPLLVTLWLAVRATSTGPGLFVQTRIGKDGERFRIWKFRSMHVDAEGCKADYAGRNDHDGAMFKIHDDPRVTAIGRIIRRYSLDELPQLFNVLTGTMSLVGPRPPLPEEVQQYASHVHRRLLVRPGLTGLWQISGRSDLSWEESVRLDLRYVENWSLGWDAQILWKTASAVLRGSGAY